MFFSRRPSFSQKVISSFRNISYQAIHTKASTTCWRCMLLRSRGKRFYHHAMINSYMPPTSFHITIKHFFIAIIGMMPPWMIYLCCSMSGAKECGRISISIFPPPNIYHIYRPPLLSQPQFRVGKAVKIIDCQIA